ncbi:kinase-like domain-containing protein [Chytridium lagenaria]|nr:kinase-like domain-containing protein [Chytridium lagenaria]
MPPVIIPSDSIVIATECLGSGASGTVYKAIYANEIVAVKTLITSSKDFQKEATTLSSLNHPRIVRCLGILLPTSIVLEYLSLGSLYAFYKEQERIPYGARLSLACDVASGVQYLHVCRVLHRDLKSLNVLLCVEGGEVHGKIGDFGLAVVRRMEATMTSGDTGRDVYDPACDIYSLGVIFSELFSWLGPFGIPIEEIRPDVLLHHLTIKREIPEIEIADDCPAPLLQLVEKCVNMNRESRLTIDEVVNGLEELMEGVRVPRAKEMGIVVADEGNAESGSVESRNDSGVSAVTPELAGTSAFDVTTTAILSSPKNYGRDDSGISAGTPGLAETATFDVTATALSLSPNRRETTPREPAPPPYMNNTKILGYTRPATAVITAEDFEPDLVYPATSFQHTDQNQYNLYSQSTYTPSRPSISHQTPYHTPTTYQNNTTPMYNYPQYTTNPTKSPPTTKKPTKSRFYRNFCITTVIIVVIALFFVIVSLTSKPIERRAFHNYDDSDRNGFFGVSFAISVAISIAISKTFPIPNTCTLPVSISVAASPSPLVFVRSSQNRCFNASSLATCDASSAQFRIMTTIWNSRVLRHEASGQCLSRVIWSVGLDDCEDPTALKFEERGFLFLFNGDPPGECLNEILAFSRNCDVNDANHKWTVDEWRG